MAALVYAAICSLDGYVEDASGAFGWAAPDEEVHAYVNDVERAIGTYLYGRRMYETMSYWESPDDLDDDVTRDYAQVWQAADKVVFSRTLQEVRTTRTRLERAFDPEAVRQLKAHAEHDLSIGGAEIAGQALRAGVVDEVQLIAVPVLVGGGKRALPADVRLDLELREVRSFGNGTVSLRYRVR